MDMTRLSVLTCWTGNGGPFITLPLVISKDPETGEKNIGMLQEVVWRGDEVDLVSFTHLTLWTRLGGPFITLALVISKDPETEEKNLGMLPEIA